METGCQTYQYDVVLEEVAADRLEVDSNYSTWSKPCESSRFGCNSR
jgi:hypothetical protein